MKVTWRTRRLLKQRRETRAKEHEYLRLRAVMQVEDYLITQLRGWFWILKQTRRGHLKPVIAVPTARRAMTVLEERLKLDAQRVNVKKAEDWYSSADLAALQPGRSVNLYREN